MLPPSFETKGSRMKNVEEKLEVESTENFAANLDVVKSYLAKLNRTKLLTKDQETEICKAIELGEDAILKVCVDSPLLLQQILSFRDKLTTNEDVIAAVRNLEEGVSTEQEINDVIKHLADLFGEIEGYMQDSSSKKTRDKIVKGLHEALFSTKTILAFTQPFKELVGKVQVLKRKSAQNLELLKVPTISQFETLAGDLYADPEQTDRKMKALSEKNSYVGQRYDGYGSSSNQSREGTPCVGSSDREENEGN